MIDTEKMRADHGTYHHVPDDQVPHCNLPIEECRRCAVDALCDENDELRREVEGLRRERDELRLELHRIASFVERHWCCAGKTLTSGWVFNKIVNSFQDHDDNMDELQQEVERLQDELNTLDGYWRKGSSKQMNAAFERVRHGKPADETTAKDEPDWLPAPDTMPEELAPAQMVEAEEFQTDEEPPQIGILPAKEVPWKRATDYRPLYSDSGLPLCSAEGLQECARFVATDSDGSVWQFSSKPIFGNHYSWVASSGAILQAPSSHRKGRCCSDSLMEVMR